MSEPDYRPRERVFRVELDVTAVDDADVRAWYEWLTGWDRNVRLVSTVEREITAAQNTSDPPATP